MTIAWMTAHMRLPRHPASKTTNRAVSEKASRPDQVTPRTEKVLISRIGKPINAQVANRMARRACFLLNGSPEGVAIVDANNRVGCSSLDGSYKGKGAS